MNWLGIVLRVIPIIGQIIAIFGEKKQIKKVKNAENVINAVVTGVEKYNDVKTNGGKPDVKRIIKETAVSLGAEEYLNRIVKKITK